MTGVSYWNIADGIKINNHSDKMPYKNGFKDFFWDDSGKYNRGDFNIEIQRIKSNN